MKKVIKGLFLMAITTLFMACSSGQKKAMEEYGKDLCKGNYEGYIDGIASKKPLTENEKTQLVAIIKEKASSEYDKKGGLKEIKVTKEEIEPGDSTAIVFFQAIYGDGTIDDEKQQMILQDGKWKMSMGK